MSSEILGPWGPSRSMTPQRRPAEASRQLPPSKWRELSPGESVWIHEDSWGFDAGLVDEVSSDHEFLWIDFVGRGRRLLCGGDPVQVWTRG
ncbi:hypothetical protein [Arthrobacter sp. NyZ413]|uniref:hypothetical protein n=1 Tax=Arthrobacter sp. NyZ413 TaxID=3144669 RepID=UPI003BF90C79